ncbi:MAG: hypothetical protein ACJA1A_001610 [Saprospiraceae bacterium]|jgi:hypothetical protein
MGILRSIFGKSKHKKTEVVITNITEFWNWFDENQEAFYKTVKTNGNIEKYFFSKLGPQLDQLRSKIFYVTGNYDDSAVELIFTADGNLKNIAFIEELIEKSPNLPNWKFTALKQPYQNFDFVINMGDLEFHENNITFYSNEDQDRPDLVDITFVHEDWSEENRETLINGIYLAIDNYLGELKLIDGIDEISFCSPSDATGELVPINKLKEFLNWRAKEFVEKYEGVRINIEDYNYSGYESTTNERLPVIAIINSDLMNWDAKASHPWMMIVEMKFKGNDFGMPNDETCALINEIEEEIMLELKDKDGYLNVGRQTVNFERAVFFTCVDYRKPSNLLFHIQNKYKNIVDIDFDIFKDKYWQSLSRFGY